MSVMSDFGLLTASYNSTLPTLTTGEVTSLQVDANGRLLVQSDVTVLIDFLGLSGASDNANLLIVGTEDGTATGTAHAFKLASDGSLSINDGGNSITVDASDLDIRDLVYTSDSVTAHQGGTWTIDSITDTVTVSATDFDIRDLTHTQDSIKVGDGTDFLAINTDGSINAVISGGIVITLSGSYAYAVTDALGADADGLIATNGTNWVDACTSPTLAIGDKLYIYGWDFSADVNAQAQIVISDGTDIKVLKNGTNSSAQPTISAHWNECGRLEVLSAAAGTVVKVRIKRRGVGQEGLLSGSLHARKVLA